MPFIEEEVLYYFTMMIAKLFENGRSQAVRLPKEYQFAGDEVAVNKIGDIVILRPQNNKWSVFLSSFDMFSNDFMEERRKQPKVLTINIL